MNMGNTGESHSKPLTLEQLDKNDGYVEIYFLDNHMEVRGNFFPSIGNGKPISREYVRRLLDEFRIIHGVIQEEINAAYERCTSDYETVMDVLIARGSPPEEEIPEYLQINPHLGRNDGRTQSNGSVDHRTRSPFIIVKKGQPLAVRKERKPGKEGINTLGEAVKFNIAKPGGVHGGENTEMEGKFLVSAINGQLIQTKGVLKVQDFLVVKGPVGYKTGNIIFPGDVEIDGPVSDGFKIYSGGSVTIKQTFDVTDAATKMDLNVAGGIIGRGQAMIKVGGSLNTKFIENCRVACRKKVYVEFEIINSKIYTMETLEMGEKGRIVGGEIYAIKGLFTGSLGKQTCKAARIHCGVDFTLEQEREKNNNILKILSTRINRLRESMENPENEEEREKMSVMLQRLTEEQEKTQIKISNLLSNNNNYENAVVEVRGEITKGTLIEICHTALFITEPLKNARIRLDKANNKLITENL